MKWRLDGTRHTFPFNSPYWPLCFTQRDFSSGKTTALDWRDVGGHVECRHSDSLIFQDVESEDLPSAGALCFHHHDHFCAGPRGTHKTHRDPGARCHVSSCPFALRTGFSSPEQQITIIIRLGWTEAWLLLQNGRKAMWKGRWEGLA